MIGRDPNEGEAYGYVHFLGKKVIVAGRNPYIRENVLEVELSPAYGIDPGAEKLVLERIYPTRWISPKLYKTGSTIELELDGYETAVYEIYPVDEATWPLPAGVVFDVVSTEGDECVIDLREKTGKVKLLNPDMVEEMTSEGETVKLGRMDLPGDAGKGLVEKTGFSKGDDGTSATVRFTLDGPVTDTRLAFLIEWDVEGEKIIEPEVEIIANGEIAAADKQGGKVPWAWYSIPVASGSHEADISVVPREGASDWNGRISAWLVTGSAAKAVPVTFRMKNDITDRPMPAGPWQPGVRRVNMLLGSTGKRRR